MRSHSRLMVPTENVDAVCGSYVIRPPIIRHRESCLQPTQEDSEVPHQSWRWMMDGIESESVPVGRSRLTSLCSLGGISHTPAVRTSVPVLYLCRRGATTASPQPRLPTYRGHTVHALKTDPGMHETPTGRRTSPHWTTPLRDDRFAAPSQPSD